MPFAGFGAVSEPLEDVKLPHSLAGETAETAGLNAGFCDTTFGVVVRNEMKYGASASGHPGFCNEQAIAAWEAANGGDPVTQAANDFAANPYGFVVNIFPIGERQLTAENECAITVDESGTSTDHDPPVTRSGIFFAEVIGGRHVTEFDPPLTPEPTSFVFGAGEVVAEWEDPEIKDSDVDVTYEEVTPRSSFGTTSNWGFGGVNAVDFVQWRQFTSSSVQATRDAAVAAVQAAIATKITAWGANPELDWGSEGQPVTPICAAEDFETAGKHFYRETVLQCRFNPATSYVAEVDVQVRFWGTMTGGKVWEDINVPEISDIITIDTSILADEDRIHMAYSRSDSWGGRFGSSTLYPLNWY